MTVQRPNVIRRIRTIIARKSFLVFHVRNPVWNWWYTELRSPQGTKCGVFFDRLPDRPDRLDLLVAVITLIKKLEYELRNFLISKVIFHTRFNNTVGLVWDSSGWYILQWSKYCFLFLHFILQNWQKISEVNSLWESCRWSFKLGRVQDVKGQRSHRKSWFFLNWLLE